MIDSEKLPARLMLQTLTNWATTTTKSHDMNALSTQKPLLLTERPNIPYRQIDLLEMLPIDTLPTPAWSADRWSNW